MFPLHPKVKEFGQKPFFRGNSLLVEKEDLKDMKVGDKMVLMKWGVFELVSVDHENSKYSAKYLPEDKNFKAPPKFTWIAQDKNQNLNVEIKTFGHLLTEKKPEQNKEFKDYVNYDSVSSKILTTEGHIRNLNRGDIIQFERNCFAILDSKVIKNNEISMTFFRIPDGKQK